VWGGGCGGFVVGGGGGGGGGGYIKVNRVYVVLRCFVFVFPATKIVILNFVFMKNVLYKVNFIFFSFCSQRACL